MRSTVLVLILMLFGACVDTTGSALVTFHAAAAGPADATGGPLAGDTGAGYHIVLNAATIHIGAIYLRTNQPSSGAQGQPCILPGQSYSGEVREGLDVDLLSADPQPFPVDGDGTASVSPTGELWLTGGPVEATSDPTVAAHLAGVASRDGMTYRFDASITIATANRGITSSDPSQPGANPICKQRIVTPLAAGITPGEGGTLLVRADPRAWLAAIDFSALPADPETAGAVRFPDDDLNQQSLNLFNALRAASTYSMTFAPAPAP